MKVLIDIETYAYKKRLHQFMQQINPKPSEEEREKIKQEYLQARSGANEYLDRN